MSDMVLYGQIIRVNKLGNEVRSVKISAYSGTRKFRITISTILLKSIPKRCLRPNQKVKLVMDAETRDIRSIQEVPADRSTAPDYRTMNHQSFLKRLFQRLLR